MAKTILSVENISKQYRLGLVGTGTLSDDLKRWWYRLLRREDPFLKVGEVNDRNIKGESDYVWALQDINFEVKEGEVLGIIGKNGAGKSTLLKILSRVTAPTTGTIKTKGRIASLLEVGTGFHPELTGLENIYLNGAILGMTKAEITSKIDEIIAFSGCERYIDTPVKRYSSGMRVRLAFAVAAHLEPDILVIDEVLAVGDAEFQKKAIGKMQDISRGEGRTVLFVSHNMSAVENLCTRAILLDNGKIVYEGNTTESIRYYLQNKAQGATHSLQFEDLGNEFVKINSISVNKSSEIIYVEDDLEIEIAITLIEDTSIRVDISTAIYNESNQLIFNVGSGYHDTSPIQIIKNIEQKVLFKIVKPNLNEGLYNITLRVIENRANAPKLRLDEILIFQISRKKEGEYFLETKGMIHPKLIINTLK